MNMVRNKISMTAHRRNSLWGLSFVSPWIIGFLVFTLYPAIYSIIISLNDVRLTDKGLVLSWHGLYHYHYAISVAGDFKMMISSDIGFISSATIVITAFSLIIALMLNKQFPARTFFRVVYFLPVIIMSGPVISKLLAGGTVSFSGQSDIVYTFINLLPNYLKNPTTFVLDNLVMILWFSGVQILIYLSGLQKIGPDIYQAASIDGASSWEKFWKITLPQMKSIALLNAIYSVVEISNYAGLGVNTLISKNLFNQTRIYSYSSAMSWLYFVIISCLLGIVFLIFRLFGRKD